MRSAFPPTARFARGAALLALALTAAASASAQTAGDAGIPAGPWFLKPYVSLEYEADDNIFRRPDSQPARVLSDRVRRLVARTDATLPFRRSSLTLFGEASRFSYKNQDSLARETNQRYGLDLELNFSNGDRVTVADRYTRGFSDIQQFTGDELVFEGEPYRNNEWSVAYERRIRNRRGWLARLVRRDFNFENQAPVSFYDYRGFTGTLEYREPLGPKLWILGSYVERRFDHFETNDAATVGEPFRKERGKDWLVGIRGELGKDQPILVQVGYGTLEYRIADAETFDDYVGRVSWTLRPGRDVRWTVGAQRRALPSFLGSYYRSDELVTSWRQSFGSAFEWLASMRYGWNEYGCGERTTSVCRVGLQGAVLERREDEVLSASASIVYAPHPRIGLRLRGAHNARSSSSEIYEYDNTVWTVSIVTGWFSP